MSRRDLSTETRPLPGEVVTGSYGTEIRFTDRREMIHPYDGRVFFAVELTAPKFSARLDRITNFVDGHGLVDFLAGLQPGDEKRGWVSADRDLAVTGDRDELTWRIQGEDWSAEVTTPFNERLIDELREFLIVVDPVDTGVIEVAGHWGARAAERAARAARMSVPAWLTAIERAQIGPGTTVLDLACGSGEFCRLAVEHGATATGIDGSAQVIKVAAQQATEAEFHVWPLGRLPWDDNSFDVVTAFNSLFFARDPEFAFEEAVRVSRNAVVVCDWHDELPSDMVTIGRAVRGPSAHRLPNLPEPQEKLTIDIPVEHPDEDSMLRAMLTMGSYQRLIESEGEEKVAERTREATQQFRTPEGGYRFANHYLMRIYRK